MKKTTIVLIDDHTLIRQTWSFILNVHASFEVTGEAETAEQGITLVENLRPDIVILDINLPGMNGIEAARKIKTLSPQTKMLGVSMYSQPVYAKKMMQAGASGYVTKNSSREEMFAAFTSILKGEKYICREVKNILSEQMLNGENKKAGIHSLSKREISVISLVRQGQSSKEIAEVLEISVKTVEVHRCNVLKKLNLKNSAALVNFINTSERN